MKYWVIAPYDSTRIGIFEKAWQYDLQKQVIAIGWHQLGDISNLTGAELESRYVQIYGKKGSRDINTLWRFYHEVALGDVIVARRGTKKISGIGTVTKPPFYDENMGKERVANLTDDYYPNFIGVTWERERSEIAFDSIMFSFYTMYEIPEEKIVPLLAGISPPDPDEKEGVEEPNEFVLEKYLEDFIVSNFANIFRGELELYRDQEGNIGQQYPTEVGKIDILAKDPSTNSYVVIELKKGKSSDVVVGQTLRYMGWIKETLCEDGQGVKGLIICKDQDLRLLYALKMVPNTDIKFYKVSFQLSDVP